MKPFYHIIFFFTFFQLTALIIAGINVFPEGTTLYSDLEIDEHVDTPYDTLSYIFFPNSTKIGSFNVWGYEFGGFELNSFSIMGVILLIMVSGAAVSIVTHSFIPAVLAILGLSLYPMIRHSTTFFYNLFVEWNHASMLYLGITLIVGVLVMFLITIIEIPTQGRS